MATVFQCAHFWGWKAPESSSGRSDSSTADEMTVLQTTLCSILVRKPRALGLLEVGALGLGLMVAAATGFRPVTRCSPVGPEASRAAPSNRHRMQASRPYVFW